MIALHFEACRDYIRSMKELGLPLTDGHGQIIERMMGWLTKLENAKSFHIHGCDNNSRMFQPFLNNHILTSTVFEEGLFDWYEKQTTKNEKWKSSSFETMQA